MSIVSLRNGTSITVRKLQRQDFSNGFVETISIINKTPNIEHYILDLIILDSVYVALDSNWNVLSTATLLLCDKLGGTLGIIEDVATRPAVEDLGIGTVLVKYVIEEAEIYGCYKVILTCKDNNIPFYEGCGMEKYQNCMCKKF